MAPSPPIRRPVVGGNWKMNTDLASGVELAEEVAAGCADVVEHCDVVVFPPFPYLQAVGRALGHHGVRLGGQNVSSEANGAFTGEVSAEMLLDLNATVVLVGHSERRQVMEETDADVSAKLRAVLAAGLDVVLCVGETMAQREAEATCDVVVGQVRAALADVEAAALRHVIIAYEPVWAIGTGRTATPEDAQTVHALIRGTLEDAYGPAVAEATRIQYGGSVKPKNAAALIAEPDIDGFLVGGASLRSDDFLAILEAVVAGRPDDADRTHHEAKA